VDHLGSACHRELHRLRRAPTGGECRGEIGHHGIARADDVDRAADGMGRDVLRRPARRGADDAPLGESDEDRLAAAGGKLGRLQLDRIEAFGRCAA
jgi:hypothetical protein